MTQQLELLRAKEVAPADVAAQMSNELLPFGQFQNRAQRGTYIPAVAEPVPLAKLQRDHPSYGQVMVGDKKRALVFIDISNRASSHAAQLTLSQCNRYHYEVMVVEVKRGREPLPDKTQRDFLRLDDALPVISLQSPQLDRDATLSWQFKANTDMALDVAKAGLRLLSDCHAQVPFTRKKLHQKTDGISVTTHARLAGDAANTVFTAPYLIVGLSDNHVHTLLRAHGTAHAIVHGGHERDCESMGELASRMAKNVAIFHPDPPRRFADAEKISLSRLRADSALVVTTAPDMVRVLKELSRPTGGGPAFPDRPGARKGGTVHAAQFL